MLGPLARLQRALIQFMLDTHTSEHGYAEVVRALSRADGDALDRHRTAARSSRTTSSRRQTSRRFYLIPTAEVPVTNLAREDILDAARHCRPATSRTRPAFRSEAGSYGKDTRGMIRQHQFEKVELVQLVEPATSDDALEELTGARRGHSRTPGSAVQARRTVFAGDIGFGSHKTYDLEVWLPGQGRYREISSCSNYRDFQARRMRARWRNPETGKAELLHTLNGSGVAAGRALIAVMENFQQADGSIAVPDVLRPYMGGLEVPYGAE